MGTIKREATTETVGSGYPAPFHEQCIGRVRRQLSDAAGLTQFGVNTLRLPPGVWSSQRHWHESGDEFVYVLEGEATLVTDAGAEVMRVGDSAGFKAGVKDGHCVQNRSNADVVLLVVGTRCEHEYGEYSDIDMTFTDSPSGTVFARKDGTRYPPRR